MLTLTPIYIIVKFKSFSCYKHDDKIRWTAEIEKHKQFEEMNLSLIFKYRMYDFEITFLYRRLWIKKTFPEIGELHKKIQWKSQFERALRSPKQEYKWKSCVIDMCTKAIIFAHMEWKNKSSLSSCI